MSDERRRLSRAKQRSNNKNYYNITTMEIKIEIKSIIGEVLFEYSKENNTITDTIIEAVKRGANLGGAYLRGAYLRGAYLRGAYLRDANLRGADLGGANNITSIDDILLVGPIGSRADYTHIYRTDKGVYVKCGCFFGTIDEFASKVKDTHGDNKYANQYLKVIDFVNKYFEKDE